MKCKNCDKETGTDARIFSGVFVCSECYATAERIFTRVRSDIESCLVLVQDKLREHLVKGTLRVGPQVGSEGLDKDALLAQLGERYAAGHAPTDPDSR